MTGTCRVLATVLVLLLVRHLEQVYRRVGNTRTL